jgi:hypothetical protein
MGGGSGRKSLADKRPDAVARRSARKCLQNMEKARQARVAHKGSKALLRYEDPRAETLGTTKRLYSEPGIALDDKEPVRAVEEHAWKSIPEDMTGQVRFYRNACPSMRSSRRRSPPPSPGVLP